MAPDNVPAPSAELEVVATVDAVATAILTCSAVASLSATGWSPVATYLPGRRVDGVRLVDGRVQVAVIAAFGATVPELVGQVRTAVASVVGVGPVDVTVVDVQTPADRVDALQTLALPSGPASYGPVASTPPLLP